VKKKAVMAAERQKLLDLFRTVMPVPILSNQEADLDMAAIEQSWQEFEAKRRDQLADLESKVIAKEQLMQQSLQSVEEHYKKIIAELKANGANGTGEGGSATSAVGDDSSADTAAASIAAIVEAEKEKMVSPFQTHLLFNY
jgi:ABC-type Fe3+ transport system substrate-binding protein